MNVITAQSYLEQTASATRERLSELYDEDPLLQDALLALIPDFEYPDFSHLTVAQIQKKYLATFRTSESVE